MLNCTVDVEPKHEVFHEKNKKKCKNPDCQCYFTPNKYNPHQAYCNRPECKRYCDKLRQRSYYRKKIRDPAWHEILMARKKNERQKRHSAQKTNTSQAAPPDSTTPYTARGTPTLLLGMLSFFTGASDREELALMEEKCRQRGINLNLNHPIEKKNKDFLTLV